MKKIYSKNEKLAVINRYVSGESITSICKSTGITRGSIYAWIKTYQKNDYDKKGISLRELNQLKQICEKQKKMIEILKQSPCSPSAPLSERYAVILDFSKVYPETLLCEALSVAKGSYYNFKLRGKQGKTV